MIFAHLTRYIKISGMTNYLHPFIYSFRLSWDTLASYWTDIYGAQDDTSNNRYKVLSVIVDAIDRLFPQDDFASLVAQEESFWWDHENQVGYIHLNHDKNPDQVVLSAGYAQGFCTGSDVIYLDDVEHLPLIESAPKWKRQVDFFDYEKPSFSSGSLVVSNGGILQDKQAILDFIVNEPLWGNEVFIYSAASPETLSDLTPIGAFSISDYKITLSKINFKLKDLRENQNVSVPVDAFSQDIYPDLDDSDQGKVVPFIFNTVRKFPCICIDKARTSGTTRRYKAASLLTAITAAYVKIDEKLVLRTPQNIDLANGEFDLPNSVNESFVAYDAFIDCTGFVTSNISGIITEMFRRWLNVQVTSSNYDLTEIAAEGAKAGNIGFAITERKELFSVIADIQRASRVGWWFLIKGDGKRTIRVDNPNRAVSSYVQNCEIANIDELEVENDPEKVYAQMVVKYNRNWKENTNQSVTVNKYNDFVVLNYRSKAEKELYTYLSSSTEARKRANIEAENYSENRRLVTIALMGENYYTLREADVIEAEITPAFVDADNNIIDGRTYLGVVRGQVVSLDPDFDKGIMKAKIRVRPWSQVYEDNIGG